MSLEKCTNCGVMFGYESGEKLCSKCSIKEGDFELMNEKQKEEFTYYKAKDFVFKNPNCHPEDVVEYINDLGLSITIRKILDYVQEGRLIMVSCDGKTHCEKCGTVIKAGRFCLECNRDRDNLISKINDTKKIKKTVSKEQLNKIKMHTKK